MLLLLVSSSRTFQHLCCATRAFPKSLCLVLSRHLGSRYSARQDHVAWESIASPVPALVIRPSHPLERPVSPTWERGRFRGWGGLYAGPVGFPVPVSSTWSSCFGTKPWPAFRSVSGMRRAASSPSRPRSDFSRRKFPGTAAGTAWTPCARAASADHPAVS